MKTTNALYFVLLMLFFGITKTKAQAPACFTNSTYSGLTAQQSTSCVGCGDLMDYLPNPTDSVIYVKVNWVFTAPSSGPGGYSNGTINDAIATLNDPSLSLDVVYDSLFAPAFTTTPAAAYIKRPRIQFVLSNYQFVIDDALYYGPDRTDNLPYPTSASVAPPAYLNPNGAFTLIFNVDTNTYLNNGVLTPCGGYGIAGGIGSSYLNLRGGNCGTCTGPGAFNWWANIDLLAHEFGHCFGLYHTDYIYGCVDDYLQEGPLGTNTFGQGGNCTPPNATVSNNIMSYSWNCRKYLSPKQLAMVHKTLLTQFPDRILATTLNPYFTVNHNYDYTVTSNETWASERHMKGDVIVSSGKTLTILCRVTMLQKARIIVQQGAKLVIDDGEVTHVWNKMWRGVEVSGAPGGPAVINGSGYCPYQGIVELKNGAIISNAEFGIMTSLTDGNGNVQNNTSGGIVIADNSSFIDNQFDIAMFKYLLAGGPSIITNCLFKITGPIGYDNAGLLMIPHERIKLYENKGLQVLGCQFEYAAGSTYPIMTRSCGIYATDSYVTVDQLCTSSPCQRTTFKDMTVGVWFDNFNPVSVGIVRNCDFNGHTYWSAIAENSNYLYFNDNNVNDMGMYLYKSKYYDIRNNTFTSANKTNYGIAVYNSQNGAHKIYRNSFSNFNVAILAVDNNGGLPGVGAPGLKMNCNDFKPGASTNNNYDIAMTKLNDPMPSVDPVQSAVGLQTPTNVVRNIYGATFYNTTIKNKWWVDQSCTQQIIHGCSATPSTNPSPQYSAQILIVPMSFTMSPTDCNPFAPLVSGGGSPQQNLSYLNTYISSLKADRDNDKNNAFEIQAGVAAKVNIFLTDTTPGGTDSVISILHNNDGNMDDADIQEVFAYIAKGDYSTATSRVNSLSSTRGDWSALLSKIIEIKQDEHGVAYHLQNNTSDVAFLTTYATTEGMDGQACAQSMLKYAFGTGHEFPVVDPDHDPVEAIGSGNKKDGHRDDAYTDGNKPQIAMDAGLTGPGNIRIYPNPVSSGVNIYNAAVEGQVTIEIKDLLGKTYYSQTTGEANHYISMNKVPSGIYIITVSKENKEVLYQSKIVKQE